MTQSSFVVLLEENPQAFMEYASNHDADARMNNLRTIEDIEACESHDFFNEHVPSNERRVLDAILLLVGIIACLYVFVLPLF